MRSVAEALDHYVGARRSIAGARELPEGLLLRCDAHPYGYELNQVVVPGDALAPAVALAERELSDRAHRRVTLLDPPSLPPAPAGWRREVNLLMVLRTPPAPHASPRAVEVAPATVRPARLREWAAAGPPELVDMQEAFDALPGARVLAILDAGDVLAWCHVGGGEIDDVAVVAERRGQGLGRALIQDAVAAGAWWLLADSDDPRPQGLYRSLGFEAAGRVVHYTWTPPH